MRRPSPLLRGLARPCPARAAEVPPRALRRGDPKAPLIQYLFNKRTDSGIKLGAAFRKPGSGVNRSLKSKRKKRGGHRGSSCPGCEQRHRKGRDAGQAAKAGSGCQGDAAGEASTGSGPPWPRRRGPGWIPPSAAPPHASICAWGDSHRGQRRPLRSEARAAWRGPAARRELAPLPRSWKNRVVLQSLGRVVTVLNHGVPREAWALDLG